MNIPVNQIVHLIEEKVVALRQGLANKEEQTVKECAAAIEAYCQLLKKIPSVAQSKQAVVNKQVTTPRLSSQKVPEDDLGSVLDF